MNGHIQSERGLPCTHITSYICRSKGWETSSQTLAFCENPGTTATPAHQHASPCNHITRHLQIQVMGHIQSHTGFMRASRNHRHSSTSACLALHTHHKTLADPSDGTHPVRDRLRVRIEEPQTLQHISMPLPANASQDTCRSK